MVILIGGESHTGKTLMAQNLLRQYHFPYTSLDHIKMGLIRGCENCGFTAFDADAVIADKLWGIVKGISQTCIENKQNIILEGCYFPPDRIKELAGENVIYLYLIFSANYIKKNFATIIHYENTIEARQHSDDRSCEDFIQDNQRLKEQCLAHKLTFFEITDNYQADITKAYAYIDRSLIKLRSYTAADLAEIAQLFYDTVHTINAKDYSPQQLAVWATGTIDKAAWQRSLAEHYSIVAEKNNKIVGFGDLADNYLDRLYVHKDYQRQGIARAIAEKLEQQAKSSGITSLYTHASLTAKPFFTRRGYRTVKEQTVQRGGILLTNFVMTKALAPT